MRQKVLPVHSPQLLTPVQDAATVTRPFWGGFLPQLVPISYLYTYEEVPWEMEYTLFGYNYHHNLLRLMPAGRYSF